MGRREMCSEFQFINLKERDLLAEIGVYEKIVLKYILNKRCARALIAFNWLRIESRCGILRTW
jgi:hypothetical protein